MEPLLTVIPDKSASQRLLGSIQEGGAVIERCPRCSERPASGPELKVSSEGSADKMRLLDVAPDGPGPP